MATYELVKRDGDAPAYHYWPEGDKSSKRGTIIVDLSTETASLVELAERDFKSRTTGTDMNEDCGDVLAHTVRPRPG